MSTMWKLQFVDQNVIALPISFLIAVVVSLMTKKIDEKHLNRCWKNF
jgi:SSS family solute:Na+ symporter